MGEESFSPAENRITTPRSSGQYLVTVQTESFPPLACSCQLLLNLFFASRPIYSLETCISYWWSLDGLPNFTYFSY